MVDFAYFVYFLYKMNEYVNIGKYRGWIRNRRHPDHLHNCLIIVGCDMSFEA